MGFDQFARATMEIVKTDQQRGEYDRAAAKEKIGAVENECVDKPNERFRVRGRGCFRRGRNRRDDNAYWLGGS